jgi:hypothetical protein
MSSIQHAEEENLMLKRLFDRFAKGAGAKPDFQIPAGNVVPFMPAPTRLPHAEPPAEDYPVNCLSPGLRKVVEAIANMTQAPSAIAAQSVLSVVSLAFASRVKVETLGSPANASCFFVLIALSGERKSAADKLAMDGINRTVLEIRAEHERALQEHKQLVSGLERGEERPPQPVCPSFLVTEPTIEGAYKAIDSEAGILGWFTDEAASFWGGHSMSKEKQALTCGTLSKFWDGSFSVRPRASQAGDGFVPPTPTTVNLMFQPILIPGTYGDEFLVSQGLLARMLPAWPQSRMGTRRYKPNDAGDRATVNAFQNASADALRDTLAATAERMLTLSDGARTVCIAFHDRIEAQLGPGKPASDISGFASKAPEHACRLAAVMTVFEDSGATSVSREMMKSACTIVEYHLRQYKHLCAAGSNDAAVGHAQNLLAWLLENVSPGQGFATDRILQSGPVGTRNAKTLDQALAILMQYDWVAKLPDGTVIGGKKRRKAYMLNPRARGAPALHVTQDVEPQALRRAAVRGG